MGKLSINDKVIATWETQDRAIVLSRKPLGKEFEKYNLGQVNGAHVYDIPNNVKDDLLSYAEGAGFRIIRL